MSALVPPHLPSTRTGTVLTNQFVPATPAPLLVLTTPIVPATWLPCQLLLVGRRVVSPAFACHDGIAGIGRIGIAPVAVVGNERIGDHVEAGREVGRAGDVGLRGQNAGVQHRHHDGGSPRSVSQALTRLTPPGD